MSLAALQREFQTAIVNDCATTAGAREGGLAIYRNAYRARLLDCMRESYDRTWTWMGDEAFSAAACHHLILHPPGNWTTLVEVSTGHWRPCSRTTPKHRTSPGLSAPCRMLSRQTIPRR